MAKGIMILENISKEYQKDKKKIQVFNNMNYSFDEGVFYCIKGKSGIGKTTLIEILALIKSQTNGEYYIYGKKKKKMSEDDKAKMRNKKIGFIFQDFRLIPTMTVIENVLLPIYTKKISWKKKTELADKVIKIVGLENRKNHYPKELSGGEQQRAAIARALINSPSIILADEPTGSLDEKNSIEILSILKKISTLNKCVIVVSHDKIIDNFADVILCLERKNLQLANIRKNEGNI